MWVVDVDQDGRRHQFSGARDGAQVSHAAYGGDLFHRLGLAALPTSNLLRSASILHACASPTLMRRGGATSCWLARRPLPRRGARVAAGSRGILRHFTAGERLSEVRAVANRPSTCGVRCIVDHSTEELEDAESRRRAAIKLTQCKRSRQSSRNATAQHSSK